MTNEPGLELHEWETRWSELDEQLRDDPASTLPAACDFVQQTLDESGVAAAVGGESDELRNGYEAARETADRLERGEEVSSGDVGAAVENLRAVYETLRASRQR